MKANQETLEALAAVYAISLRRREHLSDDGEESTWELLGYVRDWKVIRRGLENIRQVPFELLHLTHAEFEEAAGQISMILNTWGINHRRQDVTKELLRAIVDSVPVFKEAIRRWKVICNLPPTAIAVLD